MLEQILVVIASAKWEDAEENILTLEKVRLWKILTGLPETRYSSIIRGPDFWQNSNLAREKKRRAPGSMAALKA